MKGKTCAECGKKTTSIKDWFKCRGCGTHYCPDCAVDHVAHEKGVHQEQKNRRANAEKGSFENRKRAICSQCDSALSRVYSPDL